MALFQSRNITTDVQGLVAWVEVLKNEFDAFKRCYDQQKTQLADDIRSEWKRLLADRAYATKTGHSLPFENTGEYGKSIRIDKLGNGISIYPTVSYAAIVETSHGAEYEQIEAWAQAKAAKYGVPINPTRVWQKIKRQGTTPWNISEEIGRRAEKMTDEWAEAIAQSIGGQI